MIREVAAVVVVAELVIVMDPDPAVANVRSEAPVDANKICRCSSGRHGRVIIVDVAVVVLFIAPEGVLMLRSPIGSTWDVASMPLATRTLAIRGNRSMPRPPPLPLLLPLTEKLLELLLLLLFLVRSDTCDWLRPYGVRLAVPLAPPSDEEFTLDGAANDVDVGIVTIAFGLVEAAPDVVVVVVAGGDT
jgi:hypothetical protein